MEKETLEEISKEMYKGEYICNGIDLIPVWREGFILGAEFQKERSYSEEEVKQIARFGFNAGIRVELKAVELDFTFEKWFEQFSKLKNG